MPSNPFHIVDVFAERPYAGNQLAVVEEADGLDDRTMQAIAAEFGFSETTFVESTDPNRVRIFTPEAEIPFAGHPTLGTAHVVREATGAEGAVVLDLAVGEVPVEPRTVDGRETLWMTQQPPTVGETLAHERVAPVVSLETDDLDPEWPVQIVSTGLPTVIVPLRDRDALERAGTHRPAYDEFVDGREAKNVLVFCPEPQDTTNDLAVRVFADYYGVPEDPATGSSNGCLAAYLAAHRYAGEQSVAVTVEQGREMGRPSVLHLEADERGDAVTVRVGGRVVPVAEGRLG